MTQPDTDASVLAHIQRFGGDPSQVHARDTDVVKKYIG
jgi:hypothetical protein